MTAVAFPFLSSLVHNPGTSVLGKREFEKNHGASQGLSGAEAGSTESKSAGSKCRV